MPAPLPHPFFSTRFFSLSTRIVAAWQARLPTVWAEVADNRTGRENVGANCQSVSLASLASPHFTSASTADRSVGTRTTLASRPSLFVRVPEELTSVSAPAETMTATTRRGAAVGGNTALLSFGFRRQPSRRGSLRLHPPLWNSCDLVRAHVDFSFGCFFLRFLTNTEPS